MASNPATYNITAYRRERLQLQFALVDSDDAAVDLTGSSVTAHVRSNDNASLVLDLSPAIDSPATDGTISVSVLIGEVVPDTYKWDLIVTFPSTTPRVLIKGSFTVFPTISQPS